MFNDSKLDTSQMLDAYLALAEEVSNRDKFKMKDNSIFADCKVKRCGLFWGPAPTAIIVKFGLRSSQGLEYMDTKSAMEDNRLEAKLPLDTYKK